MKHEIPALDSASRREGRHRFRLEENAHRRRVCIFIMTVAHRKAPLVFRAIGFRLQSCQSRRPRRNGIDLSGDDVEFISNAILQANDALCIGLDLRIQFRQILYRRLSCADIIPFRPENGVRISGCHDTCIAFLHFRLRDGNLVRHIPCRCILIRRDDDAFIALLDLDDPLRQILKDGLSFFRQIRHIFKILDGFCVNRYRIRIRLHFRIQCLEIGRDCIGRFDSILALTIFDMNLIINLIAGDKSRIILLNRRRIRRDGIRRIQDVIRITTRRRSHRKPIANCHLRDISFLQFRIQRRQIGSRRIDLLDISAVRCQMQFIIQIATRHGTSSPRCHVSRI